MVRGRSSVRGSRTQKEKKKNEQAGGDSDVDGEEIEQSKMDEVAGVECGQQVEDRAEVPQVFIKHV